MSSAASAAPALAARAAVAGKTRIRAGKNRAHANAPATAARRRPVRGAPLRCDAIFDQLKKGVDGLMKGDPSAKTAARYKDRVDAINALAPAIAKLSDDELRAKTTELQGKVRAGADLDSLLVEAFAVVREASDRVLGLRPFDVQLIGGMILHEGQIAEMRTGEGKTLVSALPAARFVAPTRAVHPLSPLRGSLCTRVRGTNRCQLAANINVHVHININATYT